MWNIKHVAEAIRMRDKKTRGNITISCRSKFKVFTLGDWSRIVQPFYRGGLGLGKMKGWELEIKLGDAKRRETFVFGMRKLRCANVTTSLVHFLSISRLHSSKSAEGKRKKPGRKVSPYSEATPRLSSRDPCLIWWLENLWGMQLIATNIAQIKSDPQSHRISGWLSSDVSTKASNTVRMYVRTYRKCTTIYIHFGPVENSVPSASLPFSQQSVWPFKNWGSNGFCSTWEL